MASHATANGVGNNLIQMRSSVGTQAPCSEPTCNGRRYCAAWGLQYCSAIGHVRAVRAVFRDPCSAAFRATLQWNCGALVGALGLVSGQLGARMRAVRAVFRDPCSAALVPLGLRWIRDMTWRCNH